MANSFVDGYLGILKAQSCNVNVKDYIYVQEKHYEGIWIHWDMTKKESFRALDILASIQNDWRSIEEVLIEILRKFRNRIFFNAFEILEECRGETAVVGFHNVLQIAFHCRLASALSSKPWRNTTSVPDTCWWSWKEFLLLLGFWLSSDEHSHSTAQWISAEQTPMRLPLSPSGGNTRSQTLAQSLTQSHEGYLTACVHHTVEEGALTD